MIIIEIPDNPNCPAAEMRVFHDLEPPVPVAQVCLERTPGVPEWYAVTGWTTQGTPCPARMQKVDDSGDGVAFLLHGGDAGIRLQPVANQTPWALEQTGQWGEPFMVIADRHDAKVAQHG